jgi:predicted PurR-regulated permease PerM
VVVVLNLAQAVFVPVALAILLSFLLTPLVSVLQRPLGRVAAVLAVVCAAFSLIGVITWAVSGQLASLAHELPGYRHNIRQKIADIRGTGDSGWLQRLQETVEDIQSEIKKPVGPRAGDAPVEVVDADRNDLTKFPPALGPLLEFLATAGLVIILVVFILLERQQLRNRCIRLMGFRRIAITTRAFDEAGQRISRYLLRQSVINGTFGIVIGVGLHFIGVPHALLWGCLASALRFVPYVGPWVAALAPLFLSLAVFPGWARPLAVAGLFAVAELFTNMVLETLLYAGAAGVSEFGLLVAVAFWTWLWGPLGLLMATPLTVCLVVLGKYAPVMRFVVTLLGDEPVMGPDATYYQRLLARDGDEATEIVEAYVAKHGTEGVYDAVLVPALTYARRDVAAGQLSAEEEIRVRGDTAEIVDDILLTPQAPAALAGREESPRVVLACPACHESDEIALRMLQQVLDPRLLTLDVLSVRLLSSEVVALAKERPSLAICIAALPPGGLGHAKYLCKKLRAAAPGVTILVGRWGPEGLGGEGADALRAAGADSVAPTLLETRSQLYQLIPAPSHEPGAVPAQAA